MRGGKKLKRKSKTDEEDQKKASTDNHQFTATELMEVARISTRFAQKGYHKFGDQRKKGGYHDE
ncbi:hypothetical protein A3I27_02690 [Candidatus Giovannonibacteria bacterium RIFCSPLOWO2_02_FULL_43_11b]|nr:MAG: hypothetical protein A2739_03290 [Candidatus Giovannonibacteria bacterium RIFCSPHIGHO2_01_FULL_43_100]OGF66287.1 MAG: hypothetical protein A3B97_01785 [Candidatus Giovannonibacteria bacterium RIFCSPHIGHO2_02_FULL_43_32]OGF79180.1 MAG: hypothetical protein A3A15_00970 [Candidatus Giovannonibacteria bacterium RIFCSPLOWO2_01_FULL_43_60]OGF90546.1 MAG: hypothetical protein A3I27_02690 [Candidatus Giovannonibacteria bacterium RIFCSPLOWO2_02_FULL_43_11b]OGF92428.1 MAG: hypothetical protein A3